MFNEDSLSDIILDDFYWLSDSEEDKSFVLDLSQIPDVSIGNQIISLKCEWEFPPRLRGRKL